MSERQMKQSDIVKSVLYAVVLSAWASIVCSHDKDIQSFLQCLRRVWDDAGTHSAVLMCIGVFAFLTLYFHDEWEYADANKYDGYPEEPLVIQCAGWSFFLFQVCLIGSSIKASAICGTIGTALITLGIISSLKWKSIKCRFVWENCLWAIALVAFVNGKNSCALLLLLPVIFVICRQFPMIGRLGMPKLITSNQCSEKGGDNNE